MAYLFQSRQLHPRLCHPGMGTVGPSQAWTPATAGKTIVEPTRRCPRKRLHKKIPENITPKQEIGGEIVDDPSCFQTGQVWEARKPGAPRMVGWCCEKTEFLPDRALTQEDYVFYARNCAPVQDEAGILYETLPEWRDPNKYVEPPCVGTDIINDGYELICCPVPGSMTTLTMADVQFVRGPASTEQVAEREALRQQQALEEEQARQAAALSPATIIDRYGFPVALAAGVVIFGASAALFSRLAAAKKAKKPKKSKKSKKSKRAETTKKTRSAKKAKTKRRRKKRS